jgi:hypothetical protein
MSYIEQQITQAINTELAKTSASETVISIDLQFQSPPLHKGTFEFECSESGASYEGDFTFNQVSERIFLG